MKRKIIIEPDLDQLSRRGADIFSRMARECVRLRGFFAVALSGGSTPRTLHRMLCEAPYLSDIPWKDIHIFWADERCVGVGDPANNYGTARADFLDRTPAPENQVHPMPVDLSPAQGAIAYEREVMEFFKVRMSPIPVFDLIFLGIGADGHTASLFPGQSALMERKRLVVSVRGGTPDVERLTMTLPLLNNARQIVFLVSGRNKASILKRILEGPMADIPAQRVQPVQGFVTWILDQMAASLIHPG